MNDLFAQQLQGFQLATSIGLIMVVALLVVGGAVLLRGHQPDGSGRWQRGLLLAMIGVGAFFLVWLAIMVLVVGPSMRAL